METQTVSYISKEELQQIIGKNIRKIAYKKNQSNEIIRASRYVI